MERLVSAFGVFLVVDFLFHIVGGVFFEREYVREDAAALPYLRAAYVAPDGCPSVSAGQSTVPDACAPKRYWIQSSAVRKTFGLPRTKRGSDGWFRIGSDAFDLKCDIKTCRVSKVVRNAFGH
jgi:hypothetical protein